MNYKAYLSTYTFAIIGVCLLLLVVGCTNDDNTITPTTPPPTPTNVTDADGNVYNIVTIGTQKWMAKNLKTTKYKNGSAIPLVTDGTAWSNLSTPGYCLYENNQTTYGNTYGALYNWHTVNTGNLCPTGWHVPTDGEWLILANFLGGDSVAGGKLKETGTTEWNSPNTGATNESGFTALPGGYRENNGTFGNIGEYGYWWSASEFDADNAWYRDLHYTMSYLSRFNYSKNLGFSVRCLKDN